MEFDAVVGSIEDGIIALLKHLFSKPDNPAGYLNEIASYAGELDDKKLKAAIDQLSAMFPIELVAYGEGEDTEAPATSSVLGEPRIWRHDCTFTVIAVTNNARGETEQRRGAVGDVGVYTMVADIRSALSGVRFAKRDDLIVVPAPNKPLLEGDVLLNLEPLRPTGVYHMARLEGLTAYAAQFNTYFKWTEPDRREPFVQVEELIFDVTPIGEASGPGGRPGVILG